MGDKAWTEAEVRRKRAVLDGRLSNERDALRQVADYQSRRDRPPSPMHGAERSFCLPFNGDVGFSLETLSTYPGHILEFYGDDGRFSSGRHNQNMDVNTLRPLVEGLREDGAAFNYTLNASNIGTYMSHEAELFAHLEHLHSMGVEWVTVAHPVLAPRLKDIGFKVAASAVQVIKEIPQVRWAKSLGYDRLILAEDVIRNIRQMRLLLKEADTTPIEILVNNVCILHCPNRMTHYGIDGLRGSEVDGDTWDRYNSLALACRDIWGKNPTEFLKATWVRPEEISRYLELGVSHIKLSGRDWASERLRQAYSIYMQGSWDGLIFDYLRPFYDPELRYGMPNLRNKDLDDFFDFFFAGKGGCDTLCRTCRHCDTYATKLFSDCLSTPSCPARAGNPDHG